MLILDTAEIFSKAFVREEFLRARSACMEKAEREGRKESSARLIHTQNELKTNTKRQAIKCNTLKKKGRALRNIVNKIF